MHQTTKENDYGDHSEDQMYKVMAAITDWQRRLQTIHTRAEQDCRRFKYQFPRAKKSNDLEHLLLIHIRPLHNNFKLSEKEKLHLLFSLLREDAIVFWPTLHFDRETTLKDVLAKIREEYTRESFKELFR